MLNSELILVKEDQELLNDKIIQQALKTGSNRFVIV